MKHDAGTQAVILPQTSWPTLISAFSFRSGKSPSALSYRSTLKKTHGASQPCNCSGFDRGLNVHKTNVHLWLNGRIVQHCFTSSCGVSHADYLFLVAPSRCSMGADDVGACQTTVDADDDWKLPDQPSGHVSVASAFSNSVIQRKAASLNDLLPALPKTILDLSRVHNMRYEVCGMPPELLQEMPERQVQHTFCGWLRMVCSWQAMVRSAEIVGNCEPWCQWHQDEPAFTTIQWIWFLIV